MGNAAGTQVTDTRNTTPLSGNDRGSQESLSESHQEGLAKILDVSRGEVLVLYKRFLQFGPDSKGLVNKAVFEHPPFSLDPFCRQIWMRIPSEKAHQNKFSFLSFAKTMVWWNNASQRDKLEVIFSWIKDGESLSPSTLTKILTHTEYDLSEDELETMAKVLIKLIIESEEQDSAQSVGPVSVCATSFLRWCERLPQEELHDSLKFNIS